MKPEEYEMRVPSVNNLPPVLRLICNVLTTHKKALDAIRDICVACSLSSNQYNQLVRFAVGGDVKDVGSSVLRAIHKYAEGVSIDAPGVIADAISRAAYARWVKEQCDNGRADFLDNLFSQRTVDAWLAEKSLPSRASVEKLCVHFNDDFLIRYDWLENEYEPAVEKPIKVKQSVKPATKKVVKPVKVAAESAAKPKSTVGKKIVRDVPDDTLLDAAVPELGIKEPNRTPRRAALLEVPAAAANTNPVEPEPFADDDEEEDFDSGIAGFYSPWQLRRLPALHGMHSTIVDQLVTYGTDDEMLETYRNAASSPVVAAMLELWPRSFDISLNTDFGIVVSCEFFTLIGSDGKLTVIEKYENGEATFSRKIAGDAGLAIRRGGAYLDALSSERIYAMLKKAGFWYFDGSDKLRTTQGEFQVLQGIPFDSQRFFSDADMGDENCQIDDEAAGLLCHFGEWVNDSDTDLCNLRGAIFTVEGTGDNFQIATLETPEVKLRGIVTRNGHSVRIVADHASVQAINYELDQSVISLLEVSGACVVSKDDGYVITFRHASKEHIFEIHL